jgi:capsular polysaccharide biosynthesis protein
VNDPDQTVVFPAWTGGELQGGELQEGLWASDGSAADEEQSSVDPDATFTSFAFIAAALRRSAWLWCAFAVLGLLIGYELYAKFPPAYQASTSVLVMDGPNVNPGVAIQTDAALAQSSTVAGYVVQELGLRQSINSFISTYTVTPVTDQVLLITVSAPSSSDAISRASALVNEFLRFHADYARTQQQQMATELNQQITQAQQDLNSIDAQISVISAQPSSPTVQAELNRLRTQRQDASNALAQIKYYATNTMASNQSATSSIVNDSGVLNKPAPIPHPHLKTAARDVAEGLFAGLVVGMGIVVIQALVSERLRRRDDVANAIGAPVKLSVRTLRVCRWLPRLPGRASARDLNMRRVVMHLRSIVPESSRGPAGLAVVAVDNAQVVARVVTSLAVSYASQGKQVVVADLSDGSHAARLLGAKGAGVRVVSHNGVPLVVAIPDRDYVAPIGPLHGRMSPAEPAQADEALDAACASADLLLTLATLDPAFGGDHLATWATDMVAVVTAGRSSAARIQGVGELMRLTGMRTASVVLIGADKRDESLGVTRTLEEPTSARPV